MFTDLSLFSVFFNIRLMVQTLIVLKGG